MPFHWNDDECVWNLNYIDKINTVLKAICFLSQIHNEIKAKTVINRIKAKTLAKFIVFIEILNNMVKFHHNESLGYFYLYAW